MDTQVMHPKFRVEVPDYAREQLSNLAKKFPEPNRQTTLAQVPSLFYKGSSGQPDHEETVETLIGQSWYPTLSVIGMQGMPSDLAKAGNVVYKDVTARFSVRTAPTQNVEDLVAKMKLEVEDATKNKGAIVKFTLLDAATGFCAPDLPEALKQTVATSTKEIFDGHEPIYAGCGGSIPFMEVVG